MAVTQRTRRLGAVVAAVAAAVLLCAGPAAAAPPTVQLPDAFQDVPFITGLQAPTAVRFAPDGRIFVAEKSGSVLQFDGALDDTPVEVYDLRTEVYDFWDRGLLGMTLDPNFATNGFMYLMYSRDAGIGQAPPVWHDFCAFPTGAGCVVSNRLIRVHVNANSVGTFSKALIENQWCQQFPSHSAGALVFGPDNYLYASAGDGANYDNGDWGQWGGSDGVPKNPCQDPYFGDEDDRNMGGALRAQDVRTDGDAADLDGAIIRIDPGTGLAAPGNPFGSSSDVNKRRVIAYGLRNPFRFAFQPGTNQLYLGDVGWGQWEELNRLPIGDMTAENLGWPCYEGDTQSPSHSYDWLQACYTLPIGSTTRPFFKYEHGGEAVPGDGCGEGQYGSATSGVAFTTAASNYTSAYDSALFFADYARNCIWVMPSTNGVPDPTKVQLLAKGAVGGGAVDLQRGPDGDIYYVYLDFEGNSQIRHIRPVGQPIASLTATPANGPLPLDVTFNAGGSQGGGLSYAWDIDNDGFDDGTGPTLDQTYTTRGNRTVRVRVTNAMGSDIAVTRVSAGNTPPTGAGIVADNAVDNWAVGDQLEFHATGTDAETAVTYRWTLTIQHCVEGGGCHTHPAYSTVGPNATFIAPDHEWPSHLRLRLDVVDDLGLVDSVTREMNPREVHLTGEGSPSPLEVVVGNNESWPAKTVSMMANGVMSLSAPSPQYINGVQYRFARWSDGSTSRVRSIRVPADTTVTAQFMRPPRNTALPVVTGSAREGSTLSGTLGSWTGDNPVLSRQWLRCDAAGGACTAIAGATGAAYAPGAADRGHALRLRVTGRNAAWAVAVQSAQTSAIPVPVATLDRTRPRLRLNGAKRARLGNGRLKLKVSCPTERCRLRASGLVKIAGEKALKTKAVRRTVAGGKSATLTIRLSRKLRNAAARALRTGRSVKVQWAVTASDTAGNRRTRRFTVTLRR